MEQHIKNLIWLACAGLAGSFVGMQIQKPQKKKKRTLKSNLAYIINGLLVAFFFTPLMCKWFHFVDAEEIRAIAFFTGVFWSKLLERYGSDIEKGKLPGN